MDTSDAANPRIIHGFVERSTKGISTKDTWDVMGMRATRSDDTILDHVFVPDSHVVRVCPPGMAGADFFVLAIFAWALGGFSNVYYGLAQRMLELATTHVKGQVSLELTRSKAYHPDVQRGVADIVMELEAMGAQIESVTSDWANGVDHGGGWPIKLVAMKYRAVEGAWRIADTALEVSGGFGMFKKSEMERLFRDARCGRFHPANSSLSHELIGKMALGITCRAGKRPQAKRRSRGLSTNLPSCPHPLSRSPETHNVSSGTRQTTWTPTWCSWRIFARCQTPYPSMAIGPCWGGWNLLDWIPCQGRRRAQMTPPALLLSATAPVQASPTRSPAAVLARSRRFV